MIGKVFAACLLLAAETYELPPHVLLGIYQVEGGRVGQEVGPNQNGSYDLGPMQINTIWLGELAGQWGVTKAPAKQWVRTNVGVASWILRRHLNETGSLSQAISNYHSRTPGVGKIYKAKVLKSMNRHGLMRTSQ